MNCNRVVSKISLVLLMLFLVGSGFAQKGQNTTLPPLPAVAGTTPPTPEQQPVGANVEPRIGVGDLLKVGVQGVQDYDQELRVGGDGDVHLALLGPVHVAGMTIEQAQELIRKKLMAGGYFTDPQVAVFEKEFATQGVSVFGEVAKPGVYPVTGPRKLFDVLSMAGGTTPKAGQVITISHQDHPGEIQNVTLSRDPAQNMKANVPILPGDTVAVSKAGIVYVVGAVKNPLGVVMENSGNISVLQAVAVAGGTTPTAALNGAKIIRRSDSGPQEIHVQLKNILNSHSPDVMLQAEDILFVPNSKGKAAGNVALDSIVRAAVSVASYSVFF